MIFTTRCLACWVMVVTLVLVTTTTAVAQLGDVQIKTVDGRKFAGSLSGIDSSGMLVGLDEPIALADVLEIQTSRSTTSADMRIRVFPVGGGGVHVERVELSDDRLALSGGGKAISLPLQAVRGIVWGAADDERIKKSLETPSTKNDRVIVAIENKTRSVDGLLESLSGAAIGINFEGKSRSIGIEKIRAVIMADLGFSPHQGPRATITMTDGSQWVGVIQEMATGQISLALTKKATVSLDAARVSQIRVSSDRLQYLSDMSPVDVQQSTQFTLPRSYKTNRSVLGNPLTINGPDGKSRIYQKGLGVQSTSELVFANAGFDRLRIVVGIDQETRGRGDCEAVIQGDGIQLWSRRIRASAKAELVDLDVTGIKRISLIVNPGREFDLADHLNWCDARVLKTKN